MNARPSAYPLQIEGTLAPRLSRGLWLVKWLLAIPRFIVLIFLWLTYLVVTVIAFLAILFTGRYPRSLFDFNGMTSSSEPLRVAVIPAVVAG